VSMAEVQGVLLPPGWSIPTWRETSQPNAAGMVVQGISFSLSPPTGQSTSVFIPYNLLTSTAAIQAAFNARIAAIQAITG
jgi:hypothetical protein